MSAFERAGQRRGPRDVDEAEVPVEGAPPS